MKEHVHIEPAVEPPKLTQVSRLPGAIVGICLVMALGYVLLTQYS